MKIVHNISDKLKKKNALLEKEGISPLVALKVKNELTSMEDMCVNKIAHDFLAISW